MGESERAGSAQAVPAITTTEDLGWRAVAGEILVEPTTKTPPPQAADDEPKADKVAIQRGMRPLTRP